MRVLALALMLLILAPAGPLHAQGSLPRNVVLILSDDHRYDFMSFHPQAPDFLETPQLDRMAARGAHFENAFVTTSLCSPSRASILTGRYAHNHGVVDNSAPIPPGTTFFPQQLQEAGYATAFIGKWHMGESSDDPQPGFDRWVSFAGQGVYVDPVLNIDGVSQQVEGYITDLLTDYTLDWLRQHQREAPQQPFFLYLSHKAVHAEFEPAPRHAGRYADAVPRFPDTMADNEANYRGKPRWVREQRYSWHGVDNAYYGYLDLDDFYRQYAETLLALDDSIGRILDYVDESGLAAQTLVIYMSDNGFLLGEHGLIDKRQAYEESIRVPMLAYAPGLIAPGTKIAALVRNIDVAPTILDLAGVATSAPMDGRSFLPVLRDGATPWEGELLYEYYWEPAFPQTPTVFALRGDRYKYMYYHGIWDLNEFYDLKTDPEERHNLIDVPVEQHRIRAMRDRLWDRLEATGGTQIPLRRPANWQAAKRSVPDKPAAIAAGWIALGVIALGLVAWLIRGASVRRRTSD